MKKPTQTLAIFALVSFIFGGGSYLFGWSDLLSVRNVSLQGAPTIQSKNAVSAALAISVGDKLARIDPRALKARLSTFDWIENADVSRNWFNGKISIALHLRKPIALYSQPGKPQVVLDASGKTFATPIQLPDGLPQVSANSVAGGLAAIALFTSLPTTFSQNIDRMSAVRSGAFLIYANISGRDFRIIWGDNKEIALKVNVIDALLKLPENATIKLIDVSAPHAPIVK